MGEAEAKPRAMGGRDAWRLGYNVNKLDMLKPVAAG